MDCCKAEEEEEEEQEAADSLAVHSTTRSCLNFTEGCAIVSLTLPHACTVGRQSVHLPQADMWKGRADASAGPMVQLPVLHLQRNVCWNITSNARNYQEKKAGEGQLFKYEARIMRPG